MTVGALHQSGSDGQQAFRQETLRQCQKIPGSQLGVAQLAQQQQQGGDEGKGHKVGSVGAVQRNSHRPQERGNLPAMIYEPFGHPDPS